MEWSIVIIMPSPWNKNARSVTAVTQAPTGFLQKPLSKKGKSLMHYEPNQDMLLATRNLQTATMNRPMKKMQLRSATKSTMTTCTRPSFLKSSLSATAAAPHSSSFCSVAETLPNSASSMSDDEPSILSFKTWLKASLGHLDDDDIIQSTTTTTSTTKKKMNGFENKNSNNNSLLLPNTGFFSNNHVMVNRERALLNIKPLHRSQYLDALALSHALDLADDDDCCGSSKLVHSVETLPELRRLLGNRMEVGENVQRGASIRAMHHTAMQSDSSRRRNIVREAYTEFGMATALGKKDGLLYMVQLFRGGPPPPAASFAQQQQQDAATTTIMTTTTLWQESEIIHHDDDKEIEF